MHPCMHACAQVDDMSQQPYLVSPTTHSMSEPKYVSMTDPHYAIGNAAPGAHAPAAKPAKQ